ncbi:MAG: stage III sporulation protein AE [Ruminococcus flavefaciens]|nr:stage III sporulation protein AE [Eubacterium sp.]MCM1235736.1 stage III sporulation protein AE [Ruminococcus flavefaciens]
MGVEGNNLIWDEMGMDAVAIDFGRLFPEYTFDGKAVMELILQGRLWEAVKELGHGITGAISSQTGEIKTLFFTILILGIVAALFVNFADLFQDHQVSDIAFYFVYLLMIMVLLKSFVSAASIVEEILENVTTFMKLYIPTYIVAVGSAAGIASASAYYQILLFVVYLIEWGYLSILLPVVYAYILLTIINGVWMEEKLALLLELLDKMIGVCIKVTLGIITGFSILQAMISPVIDSLQSSALKKAMLAIPGIGGLTEGMFEMVVGSAVLVKNSIGLYITFVLVVLCCIPVLKLVMFTGVIKISAALIGIVADRRMTNCANRVGDGNMMLLKIALSSIGMFVIQIAVITYTTNGGL